MKAIQRPLFQPECEWRPPNLADLPKWDGAKRISIDIETCDPTLTTLGPSVRRGGFIAGVSFAIEDGPYYYVPVRHHGGDNVDKEKAFQYFADQAKNYKGILCGANLQYDLDYLAEVNIVFRSVKWFRDCQIAEPLLDELQESYSLENIAQRWGIPGKDETLLREAARDWGIDPKAEMWKLPARYVGAYAEQDARLPLQLLRRQERKIDEQDLWQIYDLESELLPILVKMRRRGIRIDWQKLEEVEEWSKKEEAAKLDEVHHLTGVRIAVEDTYKADVLALAIKEIGATFPLTPKTGKPQIDNDYLEKLKHPVADALIRARKVNKLRTTFAESIKRHAIGDRIHCTFNQLRKTDDVGDKGARYGRLSSTDPNIQQQPSRDDFADRWRSIYVPDVGGKWAKADYCFSDDTEVLTKGGFILFKHLKHNSKIAQWEWDGKKGVITYATPIDFQRVHYKGDMIHVQGNRQTDLLVTPNHNCVLINGYTNELFKVKAINYKQNTHAKQPHAGILDGNGLACLHEIVTACAVQADGTWRGKSYRIKVKKPKKIQRIGEYVSFQNTYPIGDQTAFVIPRTSVSRFLHDGMDKIFNREELIHLTPELRMFFLKELLKWDGSGEIGHGSGYCSTVKKNAEIVQEIATLTGIRANIHEWVQPGKKTAYIVRFKKNHLTYIGQYNVTSVNYDAKVYCVTLPKHTVIVRRNGRVTITGQSQQEPRMTVHYAYLAKCHGASGAIEKYRNDPNADNHTMMARLIYGYNEDQQPTKTHRTNAKIIFLGLSYGMGGGKLAVDLNLPTKWIMSRSGNHLEIAGEEAQAIIDQFNRQVPFIKHLANMCSNKAKRNGYITTLLGRRCRFPLDGTGQSYDWSHKALNRLIQGSSADQTKKAMIELDKAGFAIQLQVHDEVDQTVDGEEQAQEMGKIMEDCVKLELPSKVDVEIGPSWGAVE